MKATNYIESLMLADYYLDLGLDRISDQIRYKIKMPHYEFFTLRHFGSYNGSKSYHSIRVSRSGHRVLSSYGSGSGSRSQRSYGLRSPKYSTCSTRIVRRKISSNNIVGL